MIILLSCLGVSDDYFVSKQRVAKDLVDLESVRARLDIALKLYQSKTMQKQRAQAALEAEASGNPEEVKEFVDPLAMYSDDEIANFMRELYRGLLGGRKFHY